MTLDTARVRRRLPQPPTEGSPAMTEPVPTPARAAAVSRSSGRKAHSEPVPTDGRSLRATGRVVQLNLKTSPETKARFLALANRRRVLMVDLFEEAITALENQEAR